MTSSHFSSLCLTATVCILGVALVNARVLKEYNAQTPALWTKEFRADALDELTLHIFVKQTNTRVLEETLMRVSDPRSPDYGKHLTFEEVNRLVAPHPKSIVSVLSWLQANGIDLKTVEATPNSDILQVRTNYHVAERLLQARFYTFRHASGQKVTRVHGGYSVPESVAEHIDFVGPTVRFPAVAPRRLKKNTPNFGVTPSFLRTLYSVGSYSATASSNLQGVASFLGQFMDQSDLQSFFKQFDSEAAGRVPKIVGPNTPSNPGIEAMLDIEYIMAMGNNVTTQFWSTSGQQPHNPENEPFLKWLFDFGNTSNAPLVFSISYGDNEGTVNHDYALRVNTEFQKAGVRGVSLMASSGDGGVSGSQPSSCENFVPTFPAASPWITAVGGSTSSNPEVAASLSGGGFSNYWARPSYQTDAVTHYFSVASGLPPKNVYNHTGAGFPDVAAQAEGFNIVVDGFAQGVDGTSCSSPTFTGIVSLLNDIRLSQGKSSLGYLNPLFYQNADAFNDITSGSNPGCGTNGFPAAQGWDPVTGLGSPNFAKLSGIVKGLP